MKTSDFDFQVPPELIAHEPAAQRDHSRLMVVDRARQTIEHKRFFDIVDYLNPGDLLVLNNTKVIPANLAGKKEAGGAKVEILLVSRKQRSERDERKSGGRDQIWECLVKPGKRLSVGSRVIFGDGELVGAVLEKTESGEQVIEFIGDLKGFMKRNGEVPLPPYIKNSEPRTHNSELTSRYQTVYAEKEGASAAPTAGLHFTPELLERIKDRGVGVAQITLHTGLATFKPVYAENIEEHKMYSEEYEVPCETIRVLRNAKRVIAVGTTSVRTLEAIANSPPLSPSLFKRGGGLTSALAGGELKGATDIFIYPGYEFQVVDAMVTNFHWPRTTLIMLVSAFAGKDFIMRAYREAIDQKYRFFSFGDAMLIL
ncbi:tRNA preQ1(34) S-adenosylmethionine ribosyltransferase-isomerase QueA [candidate division WOR-1 bacterium RIFCSPHIGHO2_01_FULL_53_15]|uniref:S-adenosylmethionine:tRNA ribosyltransferase-isomerase n=1 Tax=candidate division WOR-1 bacterium RIFCSPHIGHO2_01_FULL_53_15 TaxID=1802564 RepID=A0A1F4Q2C3_UNCSA|nr:MAG: tRNA preQ1(34) S-adenosylmethionine ribosyltransferase-isomerase QueA [candidate division WOR-1 bacterium RIFCSPHIGHO2_01_FULL_53_15]OGC13649.1 MAG: tRNA preQ1(34) S-adenosylmethionine ribosyltransferase-isomerase QueA [candidate division WOR-1 bacterium RIFCSPHIGHO2_02_FULL_53_26]